MIAICQADSCRAAPAWRCRATDTKGDPVDIVLCPKHAHTIAHGTPSNRWAMFWRLTEAMITERAVDLAA